MWYTKEFDDYELLDWEPMPLYCWNASSSTKAGKSASMPQFTASKKFTKAELPTGTVIVVDEGYKYRPEGWVSETSKTSPRPGNVTTAAVKVTEAWWGNYTIRAFNLSAVTTRAMADEDVVHLRIYVPKK